jgi:hypothetical protein
MLGGRDWGGVWLKYLIGVAMSFKRALVVLGCVFVMGLVCFGLHLEDCSGTFMAPRTHS